MTTREEIRDTNDTIRSLRHLLSKGRKWNGQMWDIRQNALKNWLSHLSFLQCQERAEVEC